MTLHMIKISGRSRDLQRWIAEQDLIGDGDLGYGMHAILAANFGELAPKPFRLLQKAEKFDVIAYAETSGEELLANAQAIADPAAFAALGTASLVSKPMPSAWPTAHRLGFEVRVRPMVQQRENNANGSRGRVRETDAFLVEALRHPDRRLDRETVYCDWLASFLARQGGAALEAARMTTFRLSTVERRNVARKLRGQRGPDVTLCGTLRVQDGVRFSALLARGIGRHRTFGFGMLILKPARG